MVPTSELLAGRFALSGRLGTSRTGDLYRAVDATTGASVALRVLRGVSDAVARQSMQDVDKASSVEHPALVAHVAHGIDAGHAFVATEWLTGETLGDRLARGPLSIDETRRLAERLAEALAALHARGFVHGDVNPGNVHLPGGHIAEAKLGNWGLASWATSLDAEGLTMGTPGCMAPEQLRGERLEPAADVFALGCVLYECIAGVAAFRGATPAAVQAKIFLTDPERLETVQPATPPALGHLVLRMMAKRPAGRPPDGDALRAELAELDSEVSVRLSRGQTLSMEERKLAGMIVVSWPPAEPVPPRVSRLVEAHHAAVVAEVRGGLVASLERTGDVELATVTSARFALSLAAGEDVTGVSLATVPDEPAGVARAIDRATSPLSIAERHWVAIDEVTESLLPSRFQRVRRADGFALLSELDALDVPRAVLGREAPLVERDAELELLAGQTVEHLRRGRGGALLVTGPLGIGKSRLRQEALRRLAPAMPDLRVWAVRGDPDRADAPLELLASLVRKVALLELPAPTAARAPADDRETLRARVARHVAASEVARVTRFLGLLAHVPGDDADAQRRRADHDRTWTREEILRALTDFGDAETRAGPLLVVLEDLHWADAASLSFVGEVAEALAARPLVLWALGRPELEERLASWDDRGILSAHVRVGEIGEAGAKTLAASLLGEEASKRLVAAVASRGLGVPLFVEELAMSVAEGIDEDASQPLLALVTARLRALPPATRRAARAAAIVGLVFWRGAVAALLPELGKRAIDAGISALVSAGWVVEHPTSRFAGERELAFRHDGLRDAAEGLSREEDRELAHGVVARWLEAAGERDASLVAAHFVRAGLGHLAADHYARAAERALAAGDLAEALHRSARGLSCSTDPAATGWLSGLRAEAHLGKGEHREALGAARAAMSALEGLPGFPSDRWYLAAALAAEAAGREHDLRTILEVSEALLAEHLHGAPTPPRALAVARATEALVLSGLEPEASRLGAWLTTALPLFSDDAPTRGRMLRSLGLLTQAAGDVARARVELREAADDLSASGDRKAALDTSLRAATCALDAGLGDEAEPDLVRLVDELGKTKLGARTVLAKRALASALTRRGAYAEALAAARDATELAANVGERKLEGTSRTLAARVLILMGDARSAVEEARTAVDLLAALPAVLPLARAALADALRARGDVTAAVRESEEATASLFRLERVEGDPSVVHLAAAEALLAANNLPLAVGAIARASAAVRDAQARISDRDAREAFVALVPEHARVRALSRQHHLEAP